MKHTFPQASRATGPGAGVTKYDILTALAISGLHGSAAQQVSSLRLIALITARYNWQRNEVSIGQAEMARLWGVAPRTAKREVKRLLLSGLLSLHRPGVRGRVASYRLNFDVLEALSRPAWPSVGPDFEERAARLLNPKPATHNTVLTVDFGSAARVEVTAAAADATWAAILEALAVDHADAVVNWYARLKPGRCGAGAVEVLAPNAFVLGYVTTHLMPPLERAVAQVHGAGLRVSLALAPA